MTAEFPLRRPLPAQVVASMRALLDGAMKRVFDRPYDVRNEEDFERVMMHGAGGTMSFASAGAIAAVIARATPWIERALPWARRSAKAGKAVPAARFATYAVPIALQLSTALRHGVRELQAVASYLIHLMEKNGIEPQREFVTALTLSLALDPERRPDLSLAPGRAAGGLLRQWLLRSLGTHNASVVQERARADLAAIDRLDLHGLWLEWLTRGEPEGSGYELPPA
ncbi:MAG TPA: hypothetical protein VEP49_21420 [Acidimicrobiia bacterium]|nr:hypothetical protein [Acidimicrobiia bacterium]